MCEVPNRAHHILVDYIAPLKWQYRCILPRLIFSFMKTYIMKRKKKREFMNELMVLFYPTNIYFSLAAPLNVLKLKDLPLSYFIQSRLQLESPELKNLPRRPHKIGYLPRCDMRILLNTFPKTTDENLTSFLGRIIPQAKNKKNRKIEQLCNKPFCRPFVQESSKSFHTQR